MTDTTDTTTYGPADDFKEQMMARHDASRKVVNAILETNPLEGKSEAEMHEINARCRHLQDGLRGAIFSGLSEGINPVAAFRAAAEALVTVFSAVEQTDETRESIGYLLTIVQGLGAGPEGIMGIMQGELYLAAVVDVRKDVSEDVRRKFGMPMTGKVEAQTVIKEHIKGQADGGNVIDASGLFRKAGGETVH